ncbi:hypothetical protein [Martelella mangrovi]|uniref:Uncharacterized protein n=1 Tax=Martelella mangrovi TaxID=1397477 RepID=A0ABV2IEA6_9HYPH
MPVALDLVQRRKTSVCAEFCFALRFPIRMEAVTRTAPTFADGVALHEVLDVIEKSAAAKG